MSKITNSQKGISLYLVMVILSVVLAMVLGLAAILVTQIKTIRNVGYSVVALYAADTGIERGLQIVLRGDSAPLPSYNENLSNGANYKMEISCCKNNGGGGCAWTSEPGNECPAGLAEKTECRATRYCIISSGEYRGVKRALETKVYPQSDIP